MKLVCLTVKVFFIFHILVVFSACSGLLDVDKPNNRITGDQAFQNLDTATRSVIGIYSDISESGNMLWGYTTVYAGIYGDELLYNGASIIALEFYNGAIDPDNEILEKWFWKAPYTFLLHVNRCIEGLSTTEALPVASKNQLLGECHFLRALIYFHLFHLFGNVPLVTGTDYRVNSTLPRANADVIWETILKDLRIAKVLLPGEYPSAGRVRANKWSAASLLARCYLFRREWVMAQNEATEIVNSGIYKMDSLENVFLATSKEAIFQTYPTMTGYNTMEGFLMLPSGSSRPMFELAPALMSLWEPGDKRRAAWTRSRLVNGRSYTYPFKYTKRPDFSVNFGATEYSTMFRLAEIYLIRSESRLLLGDIAGAIEDLNVIRRRAGLPLLHSTDSGINVEVVFQLIKKERRVELFAEGGHRWFDLKRSTDLDSVMTKSKARWQSDHVLWPIPGSQIALNPALSQNPGYH